MTQAEFERAAREFAVRVLNAAEGDLAERGTALPEAAREDLLLTLQLAWIGGYKAAVLERLVNPG